MAVKKIGMSALVGLSVAVSAPAFAGANDYAGLYAGVQAGYGWAENHVVDELTSGGGTDWDIKYDLDGATGGIFGGYNVQNGMWVYGVEFDAELSNVKGDPPLPPWFTAVSSEITSQGSARGRVGYVYKGALLYATGGIAFANTKTRYVEGSNVDSLSKTRAGWTLGVGAEYAFAPNWTGRLDYRYADFGEFTDHTVNSDPSYVYHNDITEHAVRIGIARKF